MGIPPEYSIPMKQIPKIYEYLKEIKNSGPV